MSRGSRALGAIAAIAALLWGSGALADGNVASTYEIENIEARPDQVVVAWPRTCGSTGEPLGSVSLQLNPDWVGRLHEVDYEVVGKGRHEVSSYCAKTMRLHALPIAAFPKVTRLATADDSSLGKKAGEAMDILPALDAIELPKRVAFFTSDPRNGTAAYAFDEAAPDGGAVKTVHRVLVVDTTAPAFAIKAKTVTFTLESGPPVTLTGDLPPPSAGDAGTPDASLGAAPTPLAPTTDAGTRWVYAAAIGGLIAGGLIARYRKKKDAK